ncbi:Uncharacterised protein [uncultured archaeon]|nr:Uncharacterised protein [uncultured archaeon]
MKYKRYLAIQPKKDLYSGDAKFGKSKRGVLQDKEICIRCGRSEPDTFGGY